MAKKKSPWIHAWTDSVAGLCSISQLMQLCDLKNDGDYKLIVADLFNNFSNKANKTSKAQQRKLKVYMGTNMIFEHQLDDKPVAVQTIFDAMSKPNLPVIAVAVGSSIIYVKDFEPYMKFDLPLIEFSQEESETWAELMKLTSSQFGQNPNEDATESSQDNDV